MYYPLFLRQTALYPIKVLLYALYHTVPPNEIRDVFDRCVKLMNEMLIYLFIYFLSECAFDDI